MGISIVQTTFGEVTNLSASGGTVEFFNFSSAPAAGNAIVVMVGGLDITNTLSITGVTTNASDSFSNLVFESTTFPDSYGNTAFTQCGIWMATTVVGGSNSQTILVRGSAPNNCAFVYCAYEIMGLATSPLDSTAKGTGTNYPAGNITLTPVAASTLALAFICPTANRNTGVFINPGNGWTLDPPAFETASLTVGTNESDEIGDGAQHQFLTNNSPVSCALGASPSSGYGWVACAVTLKGVGALPGGSYPHWLSVQVRDTTRHR
jgi:hypothetical protein